MASTLTPPAQAQVNRLDRVWRERPGLLGWLTTTDHKQIGLLYFFTSLAFFGAGGIEALLMRTQLIGPNQHTLSPEAYDQMFTMHGITMIFLFVIPMTTGAFGNYLVPLMIGARDMAFPRMNAVSYWIFLGSGLFLYVALATGHAPNAGWFDYVPLASKRYDPGLNIDFYGYGLIFNGISSTATAINLIVTMFKLRAPGMSLARMPLFCFAFLAAAFSLVLALPALSLACLFLELDRQLGFHFYDVAFGGDPLLWQNLFWIFGHPEVYVIILPAFGIATSIIPAFTHRRMVMFPLVALAELLVAFLGFGVWVHHMFATGLATVVTIYFAAASMIIVIPSAIQLFAWITTILVGTPEFKTPLLWIVGFIVFFIIGGLSGVTVAAIPFDQQVNASYYIVAHFHFVIFGGAVFPILGGMYYWFPKLTGRMYHERIGQLSFWLSFVGTMVTFFPMHIVGIDGMPRRVYTYPADAGWTLLNELETSGAYLLAFGLLLVIVNLVVSLFDGRRVGRDPWEGATLEWATSSPPPPYNYAVIPSVTSAYPLWDARDRARDLGRLERGEGVLARGHETPASTVQDATLDEVLAMPAHSIWPLTTAVVLAALFAMLLLAHYLIAAGLGGLLAAALCMWHGHAPVPARVAAVRRALPNGVWGMALFLAAETMLFAGVISSYFYLDFRARVWPPPGIPRPEVLDPSLLTAVLVLATLPMVLAVRRARAGDLPATLTALALALVLQAGYLAFQLHQLVAELHTLHPQGSAYASAYFTLLGLHHAHVLLGVLLDIGLLFWLVRQGLSDYRLTAVRAIALYWYVINAIAVAVLLTELYPSL
ncbi:MAG TPA: cytochrome c oxidase subunit I [Solirubrobacteraceae bacterium]|nr:cytochrome c oxidase subunit I [Solirubrobacteraceae bacterium]